MSKYALKRTYFASQNFRDREDQNEFLIEFIIIDDLSEKLARMPIAKTFFTLFSDQNPKWPPILLSDFYKMHLHTDRFK